jgi:hypothetical protein
MEENPYQSPESEPEVEKRPKKPPIRYLLAACYGLMALAGGVLMQDVICRTVWSHRRIPAFYALVACPLSVLIAWWTLRAPQTKWVLLVAILLLFGPAVLGLIAIALPTN